MTEEPLGDGRFQITWVKGHQALLTVRGKDHDVTAEDLRQIAKSAIKIAERMEKSIKSL